ncbi:IS110 family transposase [Streptomyces cellulosae]
MTVTFGIDWASDHHDVVLVDHEGTLLARARVTDDAKTVSYVVRRTSRL